MIGKEKVFTEEINSTDTSKQFKIIKLVKKRKEFNQPIKLENRMYDDQGESKNNHVIKNTNFRPGVNRRIVVERSVCNLAKKEIRSFSTTQFLIEDKASQYDDEFYNLYEPKKAAKITNTLKEKYDIIEQALCSNETVDIFKEDMDELGIAGTVETGKFSTSDLNRDVKTFHPTSDTDTNIKMDKDNQMFTVSTILWCPDFEDVFLIS